MPGLAANCILEKKPIIAKESLHDSHLQTDYFQEIIEKYNLSSAMALPIIREAKVYGAVVVFSNGEDKFSDEDVDFLYAISIPIANTFEAHFHVSQILEERARLTKILENLSIGICFLDNAGKIKNCNSRAMKITGLEEGMLLGKPIENVLFPSMLNARNEQIYHKLDDLMENLPEQIIYRPSIISKKSVEGVSVWNIKLAKIGDEKAFIFSESCTDKKFIYENIDFFWGGSAFELIKKPIMDIANSLPVIAMASQLNSRQFEHLETVSKASERAWFNLRLMENLINYKIRNLKPNKTTVDAKEMLEKIAREHSHDAEARGIKIALQIT